MKSLNIYALRSFKIKLTNEDFIMQKFKFLLFATCLTISTTAQSQHKISAYKCDEINSCRGNCEYQNRKFTFLIDKSKSVVKMNVYENELFARSILFENCKAIFNSQNWDCTEQTQHSTGALINTKQMNDGIYTASLSNYRTLNGVMNVTTEFAICAK